MLNVKPLRKIAIVWACIAAAATAQQASADPVLKDGDILAICGDSITEQRQYSVFIEDYLRMCQPIRVDAMQFGWSGESVPGMVKRMKYDVLPFKPTIATTCYGMNDGQYKAIEDATRARYREGLADIISQFQAAGTRVIVGSPGAVDTVTFKRGPAPDIYNVTLAALRDEAKSLAEANNLVFANVHDPMREATDKAKQKYGDNYDVCGTDGYHPRPNGHIVMAYAFLKAMGLEGDIGTITVDLEAAKAEGSEGHKVTNVTGGDVTIESTRYPFCFKGNPKDPAGTAGIVEFVPFNQELNRYTLVVVGPAKQYRVTWGASSLEFTSEQLKAGVNLAAEFVPNPFAEAFDEVEKKIRDKQNFETKYFKGLVHSIGDARAQFGDDPGLDAALETVRKRHAELTTAVKEAIKPVTHTIKIEPIQ